MNDDGLPLRGAKQAMLAYKFGWWTEEMSATRLGQALAPLSRSTYRTIRRGDSRATYQEGDKEGEKAA